MSKLANYLQGARAEMAKVVWPNRETTINHTLIVIALSLAVAVFLGAVDYVLTKVLELVIS